MIPIKLTVEKMPDGASMDALVAEKVMGAKRVPGVFAGWSPTPHWQVFDPKIHKAFIEKYGNNVSDHLVKVFAFPEDVRENPPPYSIDMAWAWKVFERFRQMKGKAWAAVGPNHKVACHESAADLWCVFDSGSAEPVKFSKFAQGPTPMVAICRAALLEVL